MSAGPPIRPAASVILWRMSAEGPAVLMGRRGDGAAFMASKYVFPGGSVDAGDHIDPLPLAPDCARRLALDLPADALSSAALAACALRELSEEAGLHLRTGHAGDPVLRFVFRAVTPLGRPRRFDARFFLARADDVEGDAQDFSRADGELADLSFVSLSRVGSLDLPFVTRVVLAEVAANPTGVMPEGVPFFDNHGSASRFARLV